ncbi:MAG: MBL fold metallo-hydrolase [bacterium]|nr:MBL fold metallo-hydrolase [bacterium]
MSASSTANGHVSLTYYAHCAFLWQTPQRVRVLTDPYRNRHDRYWFTRPFPPVDCDLALITHTHFDHDAVSRLPQTTSVIRLPGEFSYRDISIRGILDKHSGTRSKGMPNVMFCLESCGIRFLHIGDNYIDWPEDVRQAVGEVDVLMVTVDDSCHLLTYSEVDVLIDMLQPRVVVPMHYLIPVLMPASTTLRTIDEWLSRRAKVRQLGTHQITFTQAELPSETEVWVFEPSPAVFET